VERGVWLVPVHDAGRVAEVARCSSGRRPVERERWRAAVHKPALQGDLRGGTEIDAAWSRLCSDRWLKQHWALMSTNSFSRAVLQRGYGSDHPLNSSGKTERDVLVRMTSEARTYLKKVLELEKSRLHVADPDLTDELMRAINQVIP
jgi:hypothetical protein